MATTTSTTTTTKNNINENNDNHWPIFVRSGPSRLTSYNESLVYRLLDVLRPDPVDYSAATPLVFSTAKEFEGKADKNEKWYGTPYQASPAVALVCLLLAPVVVDAVVVVDVVDAADDVGVVVDVVGAVVAVACSAAATVAVAVIVVVVCCLLCGCCCVFVDVVAVVVCLLTFVGWPLD